MSSERPVRVVASMQTRSTEKFSRWSSARLAVGTPKTVADCRPKPPGSWADQGPHPATRTCGLSTKPGVGTETSTASPSFLADRTRRLSSVRMVPRRASAEIRWSISASVGLFISRSTNSNPSPPGVGPALLFEHQETVDSATARCRGQPRQTDPVPGPNGCCSDACRGAQRGPHRAVVHARSSATASSGFD
jgi:hypothetical protein